MSLPHLRVRRWAVTARAVALLAAVLSTLLVPLDAAPSEAQSPADGAVRTVTGAQVREGPFTQDLGAGVSLQYTITYGEDARCGAGPTGDGWECTMAERANTIEVASMVPANARGHRLQLYLVSGYGTPAAGDLRDEVFYDYCNCYSHGPPWSLSWTGLDGIHPWVRVTYSYGGPRDTGFVRLSASGCRCRVPDVRTAPEIENLPPASTMHQPFEGAVIHRSQPEHLQEFAAAFADVEHHNIKTEFEIFPPGRDPITYVGSARAVPYNNGATGAYPLTVSTPPLQLPHVNGTYRVHVRAEDTSGRPTAQGDWSQMRTFEYIWNLPPGPPAQLVPASGATLPPRVPIAFVARASDPENDTYTTRTVIGGRTYHSIPAPSGREAVTIIEDGLEPGTHDAIVSAIDINGEEGPATTTSFTVAAVPSNVLPGNQPPGVPTTITPLPGSAFAAGAPQEFVFRSTDPDGDRYRVVTELATGSGLPFSAFSSNEAPSGDTVLGRPHVVLPAGDYQWRARAVDGRGAVGSQSTWQRFSVAASAPVVVSDDCATGTTVTQATAAGHYAHLQALGNDVCWRVDGPALASGGKLTVTLPGTSAPPLASVDTDTATCTTVLLAGSVGDPSDPATYVPFRLATRVSEGEAALCVDLGNERRRVRQRFPGATGIPTIALGFDSPGRNAAAIDPTPGLPSSACSGQSGSITHAAGWAGPAFMHVTTWRESSTRVHVCVRQQWSAGVGAPNVGGRFTVDSTASPGSTVTLDTGADLTRCNLAIASLSAPVAATVRRSSGTNPASVCAELQGLPLHVTAGATGTPTPPTVTWTPDPGTPGLS